MKENKWFTGISMADTDADYKAAVKRIASHLMETRPSIEPAWHPYVKMPCVSTDKMLGSLNVNLKKLYPQATYGDCVYCACNLYADRSAEASVNISGAVKVWFQNGCIFYSEDEMCCAGNSKSGFCESHKVQLKSGNDNMLIIKAVCGKDGFGFKLNVSTPYYIGMWANDYLLMVRPQLPIEGMTEEEGLAFSPLYHGGDFVAACRTEFPFEGSPEYNYPKHEGESADFDFTHYCKQGDYVLAYGEALKGGTICLEALSPLNIYMNGNYYKGLKPGDETTVDFTAEGWILLESEHTEEAWGFRVIKKDRVFIPRLEGVRASEFSLTWCGPFFGSLTDSMWHIKPELCTPIDDGRGGKQFWRLNVPDTFIRIYMDSAFFGQWFYAIMVCFYGLRKADCFAGELGCLEYFKKQMNIMADFYDYALYDAQFYGSASFMPRVAVSNVLDNLGTMGMNLLDAYNDTEQEKYLELSKNLAWKMANTVTRFSDKTFNRSAENTMWADDTFMSCPFLVRLGRYTGEGKYFDEAARQLLGFTKRLYMEDKQLYSHIYFINEEMPNRVPWGRGNGWVSLALTEVLLYLPKEHTAYDELLEIFACFMSGVKRVQDENGLWHQVLDMPDSYCETSASAMFALAFARGVNNGWLEEADFLPAAKKAVEALKSQCIDANGTIYGVCRGSECSMDASYYCKLPTITDDDHGSGIVLAALCELLKNE